MNYCLEPNSLHAIAKMFAVELIYFLVNFPLSFSLRGIFQQIDIYTRAVLLSILAIFEVTFSYRKSILLKWIRKRNFKLIFIMFFYARTFLKFIRCFLLGNANKDCGKNGKNDHRYCNIVRSREYITKYIYIQGVAELGILFSLGWITSVQILCSSLV